MKKYISMKEIIELIKEDANKNVDRLEDVDCIIAIARGGLVPAQFISYMIDCKNIQTVQIETYIDKSSSMERVEGFDRLKLDGCKKILVVDDICDTGKTLDIAYNELSKLTKDTVIENYVIINKDQDYKGIRLIEDPDKSWIVFPWDDGGVLCDV